MLAITRENEEPGGVGGEKGQVVQRRKGRKITLSLDHSIGATQSAHHIHTKTARKQNSLEVKRADLSKINTTSYCLGLRTPRGEGVRTTGPGDSREAHLFVTVHSLVWPTLLVWDISPGVVDWRSA